MTLRGSARNASILSVDAMPSRYRDRRPGQRMARLCRTECVALSKRPVHNMKTNVSIRRMTKRLRHRGKYLKAERSPQPDRRCIGFDYRIELHSPVTVCACLFQNIAADSQAYALAAARRVDNESGIGDARPRDLAR